MNVKLNNDITILNQKIVLVAVGLFGTKILGVFSKDTTLQKTKTDFKKTLHHDEPVFFTEHMFSMNIPKY